MFNKNDQIQGYDDALLAAMHAEEQRQEDHIELIASENYTSHRVMEAQGSGLTNKYAEGYPGKRYYGGCEHVDKVEQLAIDRAKQLFGADYANVQPHSGSQANAAVYLALLNAGDTVLGMSLAHGGHLTHGAKVSFSGKLYNAVQYGIDITTGLIDYDEVERLAVEHKPKMIIAGFSAYSKTLDFPRFREIADKVGAYFFVDMAHVAGLVAAGLYPNPLPYADVVTTTTHKTLRGPRGGLILAKANEELEKKFNSAGFKPVEGVLPKALSRVEEPTLALFQVPHEKGTARAPKQFVDLQNDVTAAAIELATREGFESVEHVKRYTALGFGTDQGKLGNVNGLAIAARSLNVTIPEMGTTMFRPNYTPVTFGAVAGRHCGHIFEPVRFTALHAWHVRNGAEFEDVGQWKRPWYFPKAGEDIYAAVARECKAVRESVGLLDASTLGKIDIQGPDAREFLNRIYTNAWTKLDVGKARYGLMCKEDGMVFDDGVTACVADNHFIMTTTTGGAARVLQWLEIYQQTEWPDLKVYFTSVTDHYATMTLSGPNSRKLLAEVTDMDLGREEFPFMTWKEGLVGGVPARVFRISFTGELSYEVNVQADYAIGVLEKIIEAGKKYNLTPYGTETMHVLRAEKGFIIVGQDTDGSMNPDDLNMGWCVGRTKPFSWLGQRGMNREDCLREDRKQLVGLKPVDPTKWLPEGAQLVFDPKQSIPMTMVGHVTSSYAANSLGYSFAMGVVKGGLKRMGERVFSPQADGSVIEAEIVSSVFFDPKGEQQNVE